MKYKLINASMLVVGLIAGLALTYSLRPISAESPCREIHFGKFKFINPLLECRGDETLKELKPLKSKIQALINGIIAKKDASSISVYFRDMNNGPWFGINEDEKFIPASLLKVPVMIAYLKKAETDPGVMRQEISYDAEFGNNYQYVLPKQEVQLGEKHTVEDLIYRTIVYSDNIALTLLTQNAPKFGISVQDVYNDFGIGYKLNSGDDMSVKNFASFFRVLFNASYLSKDMSEIALSLLTKTDFKSGIAAGVPSDIQVANKFGEKPLDGPNKQLHDCGIVYYPQHPYLLCIMSKGSGFTDLEHDIRDISAAVYKEVDGQYKSGKGN